MTDEPVAKRHPLTGPAGHESMPPPVAAPILTEATDTASALAQPPATSTISGAQAPHQARSRAALFAGVAIAVAMGGGGYLWWFGNPLSEPAPDQPLQAGTQIAEPPSQPVSESAPIAPASEHAPGQTRLAQATPAAQAPAASTPPKQADGQAQAGVPVPPTAIAESTQAANTQPVNTLPAIADASRPSRPKPAIPAESIDPLDSKIATLLNKGNGHIAKGHYDKAIATGESVLALDAGNRAAMGLIAKARAKQLEALRTNTSLE